MAVVMTGLSDGAVRSSVSLEREVEFYGACLADATRLQIVNLLADKDEMSSGEILEALTAATGETRTWANTSQHLGILRRYGIVRTRKYQQFVYYSLTFPEYGKLVKQIRRQTQKVLSATF